MIYLFNLPGFRLTSALHNAAQPTRSFDHDRLSVIFFLQGRDQAPYVFVRTFENNTTPWASFLGVHELVIKRERDSDAKWPTGISLCRTQADGRYRDKNCQRNC